MGRCHPCTIEYSKGYGTGVAEALGNWGFANEVVSPGHELSRMTCLLERMECLKKPTKCSPEKKKKNKKEKYVFEHSPPECRPPWVNPDNRPLIVYDSVRTTILTNNRKIPYLDSIYPVPFRHFRLQGNDKWYKLGPLCCPQPSCPVPCCPAGIYYCQSHCC